MAPPDHLNTIERKLIDNFRTGTYNGGTAWSTAEIKVFGQFPETEDVSYPCIVVEMMANGVEEQFMGTPDTGSSAPNKGELYGVGFNLSCYVDSGSKMTINSEVYKQRRLLNYLMNNMANIVMDCDFTGTSTEIVERHYTGFRDIGYNSEAEIWGALTSMVVVFQNTRTT